MFIEEYFDKVRGIISECNLVASTEIFYDARTHQLGYIKGKLFFIDGSHFSFTEFVDTRYKLIKEDYTYHYQRGEKFIFRYDNTPHYKDLSSFPHHKHYISEKNVIESDEPELSKVLREIEDYIWKSTARG